MTRTINCGGCGSETYNIVTGDEFQDPKIVCSECERLVVVRRDAFNGRVLIDNSPGSMMGGEG